MPRRNTCLASRLLIGTLGNAPFTVEDLVLLKRITDP
jgi:hypothetical protein